MPTTLTPEEARRAVLDALAEIAPDVDTADLQEGADFVDELGLDSMDVLNLATALHSSTGGDVPERDYPHLSSLQGCVSYLTTR